MTNSKNSISVAVNDVLKTAIVNGETFILTETFEEMDQQVLMHLGDQMLRGLGGTMSMNSEVEFILKMEYSIGETGFGSDDLPFTSEDITNNERTGNIETLDCWEDMNDSERDEFVEKMQDKIDDIEAEHDMGTELSEEDQELIEELTRLKDDAADNDMETYPEIMQWFTMDDRLLARLCDLGECVLDNKYWGRQAYGQAITMDSCIMKVCYDLAYCWAR